MTQSTKLQFLNSSCSVNLFGGTLTSWICNGEELIFISSKSLFDGKKAIRGGIPLVFPCFGPWSLGPQHGFARIQLWKVEQEPKTEGDSCKAVFSLEDNEITRDMWDKRFKLLYTVTLSAKSLTTELTIQNNGPEAFEFTCLLHTYFKVPDVRKVTVSGLKGLTYTDKVKDGKSFVEERELVKVEQFEDRVYGGTPDTHVLTDTTTGRTVTIQKNNLPDTVVWNPWAEKAAAMSDFGDDDYPYMICVEAGRVITPASLPGGQTFHCGQTLTMSPGSAL